MQDRYLFKAKRKDNGEWVFCGLSYCNTCGKKITVVESMNEEDFCYCHNDDTDEYHDCLDYMECEECPYYYADLD